MVKESSTLGRVEPEQKRYLLTVRYLDPDGRIVAKTRKKSCVEGLLYVVDSPVIIGMETEQKKVVVNLFADQEVAVRYRRV